MKGLQVLGGCGKEFLETSDFFYSFKEINPNLRAIKEQTEKL
jgi:hypothetical protein